MSIYVPGLGDIDESLPEPEDDLGVRVPHPLDDSNYGGGVQVCISKIVGLTNEKIASTWLKSPLWFQCPPLEDLPRSYEWSWNDYPTLGGETHSSPAYRQLPTVTFNSLFVDDVEVHREGGHVMAGPNFAVAALSKGDVLKYVAILRDIGDTMTPFALTYGNKRLWGRWEYNRAATLRSFQVSERAGEIDARYFTCAFTEYPDPLPFAAPSPPKPPGSSPGGRSILWHISSAKLPYKLRTLALIAKKYYKAPARWRLIYTASGLKSVGPNTDLRTSSHAGKHKPHPVTIIVPRKPS